MLISTHRDGSGQLRSVFAPVRSHGGGVIVGDRVVPIVVVTTIEKHLVKKVFESNFG